MLPSTSLLLNVVLTLSIGLFVRTSAWAQEAAADCASVCQADEVVVGSDEDNCYCRKRVEYERSRDRLCQAKRVVAADQSAIRALGVGLDAERLDDLGKLGKEQKADLQRKIFDGLVDVGVEGIRNAFKQAKSLNPVNVNEAAATLEAKGFGYPVLTKALRTVASVRDKPKMFAAYEDFAKDAQAARDGWRTQAEVAKDPDSVRLRLLAGALKMMQGNKELGLLIMAAEFGESFAYLAFLNRDVTQLTNLVDDKLSRIASLSARLRGHVKDLAAARQDWRQSIGAPEPACAR